MPDDYDNYVTLLRDIRDAFDSEVPGWEVTITLPASYWYIGVLSRVESS